MFKFILPMLLVLNFSTANASENPLDRADVDKETVTEIINLFTGDNFDLADYSYDKEVAEVETGMFDLISVEVADEEDNAEFNVVITLKKKWEFSLNTEIVDTKQLTKSEWRSRIYARDAHRVESGSARYRFNDIISAGPAVLRSTNWVGQLPRDTTNPKEKIFVGGNIKIILK